MAGEALVGGGAWRVEGGGTTNAGEDTGTVCGGLVCVIEEDPDEGDGRASRECLLEVVAMDSVVPQAKPDVVKCQSEVWMCHWMRRSRR